MARKIEFMKRSEARIIIYLINVAKPLKHGDAISMNLEIDYIYTMKILRGMYEKGWIKLHKYDGRTYFNTTLQTPIEKARERISENGKQTRLDER